MARSTVTCAMEKIYLVSKLLEFHETRRSHTLRSRASSRVGRRMMTILTLP